MKLLSFIVIFAVISCTSAPLTPEQQHKRENALIVERELFWLAYDNCIRNMGVVVFKNNHWPIRKAIGAARPKINIWDMRFATCLRRP